MSFFCGWKVIIKRQKALGKARSKTVNLLGRNLDGGKKADLDGAMTTGPL